MWSTPTSMLLNPITETTVAYRKTIFRDGVLGAWAGEIEETGQCSFAGCVPKCRAVAATGLTVPVKKAETMLPHDLRVMSPANAKSTSS